MASAPALPAPLQGFKLALAAIALALGTFMQVLDTTIANVSLPTIAGNLGVSSDNSTWVITAFAVANGACVPLTGWLMGRFGVVRTFCASVIAFTLASFLCGIAWNLSSLIVFRVLQGAVSGPMIPGSQALLLSIFPAEKRSTGLGIWSMTALVGPICGPVLGGYISDNYHWGWIFLINVPIGLLCGGICWRLLANRETPTRKLPIDTGGVLLLFLWVGALQITLDLGKDADWFNATRIVVLSLVAIIGFVAWLIWELTAANPVVDLSLFKRRNFLISTLCFCLAYAVLFGNMLLLPLWLQTQLGYTATWAGLASMPAGLVAVVLTPFAARLANKVDARLLAAASMVALAFSYYLRTQFTSTVDFWQLIIPIAVQGVGMSTFFLGFITIALDGIPPERLPSASGLQNFMRITAGSFAASLTTVAWDRRETLHQSRLVEAMGHGPTMQAALDALQHGGMTLAQASGALMRQVIGQAYLLASVDLFRLSECASIFLIFAVWLTRRPAAASGPIAAD
jgi:MFS transporter, DHA2 family, multidrug resistance protein